MKHFAILILIMIVLFFKCIDMYGNNKYPNFNKNPFLGYIFTSILFWLIFELVIWSVKILIS